MNELQLKQTANEVRKWIVTAVYNAKAGHPGGSLSAADMFTYLYFEEMKIDPKKIKDVIGKGGAVIRSLTEETGTSIDIADDGTVKIAATENAAAKAVMARIEDIVADVEVNRVYNGKVTRIADFGAFVAIVGNKEGLVHISQIAEERVEKVTDYLQVGQEVAVRVVEIDRQGRIRLTMRDINNGSAAANSSEELVTEDDQA